MKELKESDREKFYSLFLDGRNTVISCEEISSGSPNSTIVHPREVFKSAFLCSSTAVIFVHNHPSGAPEPSFDDKPVMGRLYQCGEAGHRCFGQHNHREGLLLQLPREGLDGRV